MFKKKILVPTNFSELSEIAFKQSLLFSHIIGFEVVLLHVVPDLKDKDLDIDLVQNAIIKMIDKYRSLTTTKTIYRIEEGKVLQKILEVEEEIQPSYIFLGTDLSMKLISSKTLKLIDEAKCPIVIFGRNYNRTGCQNIVLPLDLTKETKQKVKITLDIAKLYNSNVHIISAANFEDEIERDKLKNQILSVQAIFENEGINCFTKLIKTKDDIEVMANAINDYADDVQADLIVIMTRQETKLQQFFVGSMATKLIKKSKVPVLCVSPKK
ncbi:MAG TPA: universal stress protein [Bacteroidales bacterium]|nr:universal stress protein [Bacteroidales bacterium]HUM33480.1 universal stress protein [Bacteroidales bacterium]